jgi:CRISPR-associated protein Csx10
MSSVIRYRIKLLQPVLATALEGDPNSGQSFPYLPGSVLRGAWIGHALRGKGAAFDAPIAAETAHFFSPSTRFLNGYLLHMGRRMLPVPRSWQQVKGDDNSRIYDALLGGHVQKGEVSRGMSGFVMINGDSVSVANPGYQINVHIQRDRNGTPRAGDRGGQVYRYEPLDAGQEFEAFILCDDDTTAFDLIAMIKSVKFLHIGGARSAGYGSVAIEYCDDTSQVNSWQEPGGELRLDDTAPCSFVFLSDAILRDANGQHCPDLDTLQTALTHAMPNVSVTIEDAYLSSTFIGGFNRKWGLPLPQTPALAMGSVVRVIIAGKPEAARKALEQLAWYGMGERRNEGFGRIAVNWLRHAEYQRSSSEGSEQAAKGNVDQEWATLPASLKPTVKRLISATLERKIIEQMQSGCYSGRGISTSQLNNLRNVLAAAMRGSSFQPLHDHLNKMRDTARHQIQRAQVNEHSLDDWLRGLGEKLGNDLWTAFLETPPFNRFKSDHLDSYKALYLLKLADAVLARMAASAQKKERDHG